MNIPEKEIILERIKASKKPVIISIDGRCASGKSTFARELAEELNADVIHMDDFYLRKEQRTPERYAEPGGNVDAERFLSEVLIPLKKGKAFTYHPFDCSVMEVSDKAVPAGEKDVTIIEGSYSQRADLRDYHDLKIFLDVRPDVQMERIRKRNPDKWEMFRDRWIPLEELYFDSCSVKDQADIVIDTSDVF